MTKLAPGDIRLVVIKISTIPRAKSILIMIGNEVESIENDRITWIRLYTRNKIKKGIFLNHEINYILLRLQNHLNLLFSLLWSRLWRKYAQRRVPPSFTRFQLIWCWLPCLIWTNSWFNILYKYIFSIFVLN